MIMRSGYKFILTEQLSVSTDEWIKVMYLCNAHVMVIV